MNIIDPNNRPNPAFLPEQTKFERAKVILEIALTAIGLFQPVFQAQAQLVVGVVSLAFDIKEVVQTKKGYEKIAYKIAVMVATFFFSYAMQIVTHSVAAIQHGKNAFEQRSIKKALLCGHEVLFVVRLIKPTPEMILITTIAQVVFELARSYEELFQAKRPIEAFAFFALAILRIGAQLTPQAVTVKRNHVGKKLTQNDFERIVKEKAPVENKPLNLEKVLVKEKYKTTLDGIKIEETMLQNMSLNNLRFNNCSFNKTTFLNINWNNCFFDKGSFNEIQMTNSKITNTFFLKCSFINAIFNNTVLHGVSFVNSNLADSVFYLSDLKNCKFVNSFLQYSTFFGSKVVNTLFKKTDLTETCFFKTDAQNNTIEKSNLLDTILPQTGYNLLECAVKKTKPIIALGWVFEQPLRFGDLIHKALRDQGANVLRIPKFMIPGFNSEEFKKEAGIVLKEIRSEQNVDSIAIRFLEKGAKLPQIRSMLEFAKEVGQVADGLVIPGGHDVEQEYYDITQKTQTDTGATALELALSHRIFQQGKMLVGVCRGCQLINVLFGGTVANTKDDHFGEDHYFKPSQIKASIPEAMQKLLSKPFRAISMHHQAAVKIGKGLKVLLDEKGSPELITNENGKVLLMQFHPEYYIAEKEENNEIRSFRDFLKLILSAKNFEKAVRGNFAPWLIKRYSTEKLRGIFQRIVFEIGGDYSYGKEFWKYAVDQARKTENALAA